VAADGLGVAPTGNALDGLQVDAGADDGHSGRRAHEVLMVSGEKAVAYRSRWAGGRVRCLAELSSLGLLAAGASERKGNGDEQGTQRRVGGAGVHGASALERLPTGTSVLRRAYGTSDESGVRA